MLKFKALKRFFSVCLIAIIISIIFYYFYIQLNRQLNEKDLLNQVEKIIDKNRINFNSNTISEKVSEEEIFSVSKIKEDNNLIGKIIIKKIGVEAPIMDGTSQEVLKKAVGHFQSTSYWDGNVGLASHNRGSYAHYFENINKLTQGDEIVYQTKLGSRVYTVNEVMQIDEVNWEPLNPTPNNTITLITCVSDKPEQRLCVKAMQNI